MTDLQPETLRQTQPQRRQPWRAPVIRWQDLASAENTSSGTHGDGSGNSGHDLS